MKMIRIKKNYYLKVLESLPFINLTKKQEIAIRNGQKICFDEINEEDKSKKSLLSKSNDSLMICKNENKLICFFKIENNFVKPIRVFNL